MNHFNILGCFPWDITVPWTWGLKINICLCSCCHTWPHRHCLCFNITAAKVFLQYLFLCMLPEIDRHKNSSAKYFSEITWYAVSHSKHNGKLFKTSILHFWSPCIKATYLTFFDHRWALTCLCWYGCDHYVTHFVFFFKDVLYFDLCVLYLMIRFLWISNPLQKGSE